MAGSWLIELKLKILLIAKPKDRSRIITFLNPFAGLKSYMSFKTKDYSYKYRNENPTCGNGS